jgi:hypothetical protein
MAAVLLSSIVTGAWVLSTFNNNENMTTPQMTNPQPFPGRIILKFTREQLMKHNLVELVGDKQIVISDRFFPDEWSIEEATVYAVSDEQTVLKPGQQVLIDYGIFSDGRYGRKAARSRLIATLQDGGALYWAYDDQSVNTCEIFATIDDTGEIKAFNDCVICYRNKQGDDNKTIDVVETVEDQFRAEMPKSEWQLVCKSPVQEIKENNLILCEKGFSPKLKFRNQEMQYTTLAYILGVYDRDEPLHLKLF